MNKLSIDTTDSSKGDMNTITSTPNVNSKLFNYVNENFECLPQIKDNVSMSTPYLQKINLFPITPKLKSSLYDTSKISKRVSFREDGLEIIKVQSWKRSNLLISKRYSGPEDKCNCLIV